MPAPVVTPTAKIANRTYIYDGRSRRAPLLIVERLLPLAKGSVVQLPDRTTATVLRARLEADTKGTAMLILQVRIDA